MRGTSTRPGLPVGLIRPLLQCLLGAMLLVLTACSASQAVEQSPVTTDPPAAPADDPTSIAVPPPPTSPPIPPPIPPPTPEPSEPEPSELVNEDVYRTVQNSIVYIEAPDRLSSGSGIVLDGGWILTNAHVVNAHESMRVGRSDGTELGLQPVHLIDWTFDLALVGPVDDTALTPISPGVSADLALGSRVLLVGFPDEETVAPTPTLTEGIVSRQREISIGNYPFIQVDATIAPGQSGGALVNSNGELVGISGLEFGAGEFGMAFASDPLFERITRLLEEPLTPALPATEAQFQFSSEIGSLRTLGYLMKLEETGSVDILAIGDADMWIELRTPGGDIVVSSSQESNDPFAIPTQEFRMFADELGGGGESLTGTVDAGLYQVIIGSFTNERVPVDITSSELLQEFADVDEGRTLPANQIVEGSFEWHRDSDRWLLELQAGDAVTIVADGIADTVIGVYLEDQIVAGNDDAGLGIFGTGSRVEFIAESAATYVVEIGTLDATPWGYLVQATVSPVGG